MIKKITLQFTLYRSVIFSNTVITITLRKSKTMRDKISSLFFSQFLQVCKQEFHQVCKKKKQPQVNLSVHSTSLFKQLGISLLDFSNMHQLQDNNAPELYEFKKNTLCNNFETNAYILILPFLHACL